MIDQSEQRGLSNQQIVKRNEKIKFPGGCAKVGVGWGIIIKILIGRRGGLVFEKRGGENTERKLIKKT